MVLGLAGTDSPRVSAPLQHIRLVRFLPWRVQVEPAHMAVDRKLLVEPSLPICRKPSQLEIPDYGGQPEIEMVFEKCSQFLVGYRRKSKCFSRSSVIFSSGILPVPKVST